MSSVDLSCPILFNSELSIAAILLGSRFISGVKASKGKGAANDAHGALVIGFDPIGDLVSELRRRFGHLAVFFSPGPAGSSGVIGLVWRPSAFVPRPYNINRSRYMMVTGGGGDKADNGQGGVLMTVNVLEVLAEMKALGGDMFEGVHLS